MEQNKASLFLPNLLTKMGGGGSQERVVDNIYIHILATNEKKADLFLFVFLVQLERIFWERRLVIVTSHAGVLRLTQYNQEV